MKSRVAFFVLVVLVWVSGLAVRLYSIQIAEHDRYKQRAEGQHYTEVKLTPPRGTIYARGGRKLAASVDVDSVLARLTPDEVQLVAGVISETTGENADRVAARLTPGNRTFVARQVEPAVASALKALNLEDADFIKESKRFYPLKSLAGPLLGFVGTDHTGLSGLEAAYDEVVSGKRVERTLLQDALRGRAVAPGMTVLDAEPGDDLHLTIDAGIQYVVERELARAIEEHSAKSASAVFMDPQSGAIYAMASLPSFDPNQFSQVPPERWRNRVIQDAYEPGSTMKMVTAVAALEANLVDPLDVFDCEMGAITLGSTRIRDHKPFGLLTFREVIAKSSNVGAIKAGMLVGADALSRQIEAFGFGSPTGVDLPGESKGIVRPVERWSRHEVAYASIGHGLSITPIQLVRAFGAVANGGRLVTPYVVERSGEHGSAFQPVPGEPVLAAATNRTLLRLLEAVVEEGTGQAAGVPGYRVAGKTGTAQKVVGGSYTSDRHVASFAGFAPSRDPRIVGVVVVDEPRGRFHGGEVAAPVFSAILNQALPLLGVAAEYGFAPDAPAPQLAAALTDQKTKTEVAAATIVSWPSESTTPDPELLPSFTGLSARQALRLASEVGVGVEFRGSGFVRRQEPAAGMRLESVDGVVLQLEAGRRG
jgi:cell division protein FtsI (penicillin-binding protein 3)